jgi:hypothetical protein
MLTRAKKLAAFVIFTAIIILSVPLYIYSNTLNIEAAPGLSRDLVHETNGQPCGTAYFKCCGVEKYGKMALLYDVWELPNAFGSHRTIIHYDADNQVITKENAFQWFYEPTLYGLGRDSESCLQYLL